MNDRETLKTMLYKSKIKFHQQGDDVPDDATWYGRITDKNVIIVQGGYVGFFSEFKFDDGGNLVSVEAYE